MVSRLEPLLQFLIQMEIRDVLNKSVIPAKAGIHVTLTD
jgi:hypothetical protein